MEEKKIQKYIAESGYCSRRKAEDLVQSGAVSVDGERAHIGQRISDTATVLIQGRPLNKKADLTYIKLNKPPGYVCSNRSFKGERSVFELVASTERLFVVGRLDKESRGLVVLTNDGAFAHRTTHPSFGHEKEYRVRISTDGDPRRIEKLFKKGVDIGGGEVGIAVSVHSLSESEYSIVLRYGKKRQIRRMFAALGYTVTDLLRTRIDTIYLGSLPEGETEVFHLS